MRPGPPSHGQGHLCGAEALASRRQGCRQAATRAAAAAAWRRHGARLAPQRLLVVRQRVAPLARALGHQDLREGTEL
jgi:hypothetical protein